MARAQSGQLHGARYQSRLCLIASSSWRLSRYSGGANPFGTDGILDPAFAWRLEWLAREADRRDMVLLIGVIIPIKDQELGDEAAIRTAIEETARLLETRRIFAKLF